MNKLRVGVLMGGKSIEREVSFNSGRTVCDHLDTNRYDIIPLFQCVNNQLYLLPWHFLHRGKISDFEHRLKKEAQLIIWDEVKQYIDFMFIAVHGQFAEDGRLQGLLEVLKIPYLGSGVLASALGMNKIMQKDILSAHGIAVARGIALTLQQIENFGQYKEYILTTLAQKNIMPPYIIKPCHEGSSLGVSIVQHEDDLEQAVLHASCINQGKKQEVLIEEKVEGMEFSCVSLYDYKQKSFIALPPTEVVHRSKMHIFDYEQKYMPGQAVEFTPARCDKQLLEKIKQTCIQTTQILGMSTFSRIDGFLTAQGTVIIIDPNSFSGLAPSSFVFREAAEYGMNHPQLINHLIETSLDHYGMLDRMIEQEQQRESMSAKKLRIAVLLGGNSNEKEISLESGRNIVYKLTPSKYDVIPLFVNNNFELYHLDQRLLVRNSTAEIEQLITTSLKVPWGKLPELVDFVFIALHGGLGENGSVQGTLEMLGLPYNGSNVLTSALCMDKFKTNSFLKAKGFDVPGNLLVSRDDWRIDKSKVIATIIEHINFPLIVKPHDDGCSVMVKKIAAEQELFYALDLIFENKSYALIEEYITGMELTVGVIGNNEAQALPPSQAITNKDILSIQEKFLPGAGENQTPAGLPRETITFVQQTMEAIYTSLGCKGYARIDCFYQNAQQSKTGAERVIILEVNTLPGLTPATCIFHQAAEIGIKPREFIDIIIALGQQNHNFDNLINEIKYNDLVFNVKEDTQIEQL